MSEKIKIKGLFAGFILGGAIGGTIALLYAPKSGKHLRSEISWKAKELTEDWKKNADCMSKNVKENAENMLDGAKELLNAGKKKIAADTENLKTKEKNHNKFL
ncbi:MAG: YtxH domain-containing protein [Ignavibacteria bacterium]|nr:YtxH domain-containing protein [Ignavibacteria bacterium]